MKKAIKIILISLLSLIILAGLLVYLTFGDLVRGALSVKKIDDRFYYMEFRGDDGFDDFIASGGAKDANQLVEKITDFLSKGHYKPNAQPDPMKYGCAAFTVKNNVGEKFRLQFVKHYCASRSAKTRVRIYFDLQFGVFRLWRRLYAGGLCEQVQGVECVVCRPRRRQRKGICNRRSFGRRRRGDPSEHTSPRPHHNRRNRLSPEKRRHCQRGNQSPQQH